MTKPLLFSPLAIQGITFKNRVVIAPMATYSAVDGIAQDFHFAHLGRLALGGAACVFVEATAVTAQGRITNGDMGLWSSAHIPPLRRIAAFMKSQNVVPGIQIAHAGRKGSMQRPWFGNGPLTPEDLARGEKTWDIVAPTSEPMAEGYIAPRQLSVSDLATLRQAVGGRRRARAGGRLRHPRNPQRARLSDPPVPLPALQQAQRCLRRRFRRAHALSPRGRGGGARGMAEGQAVVPARFRRRRHRRRLDHGRHGRLRQGIEGPRRRRDRLLLGRPVRLRDGRARQAQLGLPGALRGTRAPGGRHQVDGGRASSSIPSSPRKSCRRVKPT